MTVPGRAELPPTPPAAAALGATRLPAAVALAATQPLAAADTVAPDAVAPDAGFGADDGALRSYYAQRAPEYERIYHRPERQADLRRLEARIAELFAGRDGLEIACGTGWWTPHAARRARAWLATDLSDETLAIARTKPLPPCVRFARLDAWALAALGARRFDAAFAGFWWSHLPRPRLAAWLQQLHAQLEPGARVAFVDNRYVSGSSTPIARTDADGNSWQQRRLDDGSTHEVLKNFPTEAEALAALGLDALEPRWTALTHYWLLTYVRR
jgi:demethylmenaquinone methyltransferase/2-methoxy-6-polyprenyl-1,4-benzoquinol methylase